MLDAVIEVIVEASQQNVGNEIKAFKTQIGDIIFGGFNF
jgi:hypothetical protein